MDDLRKAIDDLYESCMNVGWDGKPSDPHVAQLLVDAMRVLMLVPLPSEEAVPDSALHDSLVVAVQQSRQQRIGDQPV